MANGSPPIIGLAGGVGSGKSTVSGMLAGQGCFVVDSDALGRAALRDPAVRDRLVGWWGPGVLDDSGEIDRRVIAGIVFSSPAQRRRLESLVHPWIEARRKALFDDAPKDARALVIDAPLLFEAGLDEACDAVIFVETDRDTRRRRLAASREWDENELAKREDSQLSLDEKRTRSDYVIANDGDLRELEEQVRRTLNEIVRPRRS